MVAERRAAPRDWLVLGATIGLLLVPKVTGALSAVAIAASRPLARTLAPWLTEIGADYWFRLFRADVPADRRR
jgi:hypothetical protein